MSEFSKDWLQLREAADHRARGTFEPELQALSAGHWHVIDLGCGTGSNLRFLAPKLPGAQTWDCIDADAKLLESLATHAHCDGECAVTLHRADLTQDVAALLEGLHTNSCDTQPRTLVTASALLDLVCDTWIDTVVATCARLHIPALFALTYDGRIELQPGRDEDTKLQTLVNAHQLSDKGFGPALGPRAHKYARMVFERSGFTVAETTSDWRITSQERELQRALLAGWLDAAREQSGNRQALAAWHAHRRAQVDTGELQIGVGHRDLLAVPPQASGIR